MSEAAVPLPWPDAGDAGGWLPAADVPSAITSLHLYGEEIRAQGLAVRRLRGLSAEGRGALDALATRIVAEFLHAPTIRLQEAATSPEGAVYARTVRDLFGEGRR
jgi:glutamyl-tRNA reductase